MPMENPDIQHEPVVDSTPLVQLNALQEDGVHFDVNDNFIEIRPTSGVSFQAWVDKERVAHLNITTIRADGSTHPYFERHRASEIAKNAISHFDQFGTLKGLAFDWGRPTGEDQVGRSDNYTSYLNARNALMPTMDYESAKRQAALQTWTLRNIALPLQFSEITTVEEKGDPTTPISVLGIAYRPDVLSQMQVAA